MPRDYRVVDTTTVEPTPDRPCRHRALAGPAGLDGMAINRYEADPGEQLPLVYHYHDDQEEAFYVIEGALVIETPEGIYTVEAGELFAVQPGNPHRAYNPENAAETAVVLAIGAPAVEDDAHPYEP